MAKTELLMVGAMASDVMAALEAEFHIHRLWEADDQDRLVADIGERIEFVATNGHAGCSAALMGKLPALKIIGSYGVGYDAVDIDAARARGIRVTNTPDVLNDAVAELTLGLMLALCRRIVPADAFVRAGKWEGFGHYPLTDELTGKTVGILGLGRIGKEIARRCQVFRMQVVYHGRTEQPFEPYPYFADLVEMARASDWLVVIVPGGGETDRLVNREVLEALGPEGAIVSIGRGTTIDEAALVACLQEGTLGGAALDVFEEEPAVPEALFGMENVVLSPHQGSATHKTRTAMGDLVVQNLIAFRDRRQLITPVV